MLGVVSSKPFPIRRWLVDASPGLLGLSLRGKNAPHRDGLGYAFRDPFGKWRLFRFGPRVLTQNEIPGPIDSEALVLLAHARKSSREYRGFCGAVYAHPFFYDGVFLCHNGTVRDAHLLGDWLGTDTRKILLWLGKRWRPRSAERLEECLAELLQLLQDYTGLNLLISDGENLYALCAYKQDPDYFTLWVREGEGFVVVASEPADEERAWYPLQNRELLVIFPGGFCERKPIL
ncbi:class II glutamine amidotransferase [Candidatus Bipolaricaulota bacterium]|nr:class II glutamine amidotransferase [Candidatus Bipolaricaulota bacterium]